MPSIRIFAAALTVIFGTPAIAQSADQDVRCILAGNAFGMAEKDPAKKQLALATSLFFAGRADARLAPAQFKAQVLAQGKALSTSNAADVMTACAKTFQAKERAMQAVGQEVARSQAQPTPKK